MISKTRVSSCVFVIAVALALAAFGTQAFAGDLNEQLLDAAKTPNAELVERLLDEGADVNTPGSYGATALSYAAEKGHAAVAALLIERGADVNVRDTFYKSSPLDWAAPKGHTEIVRRLLEAGAEGADKALRGASRGGHVETAQVILEKAKLDEEALSSALRAAPEEHREKMAALLVPAGAKMPEDGPMPDAPDIAPERLAVLAGSFFHPDYGTVTVAGVDGKLAFARGSGPPSQFLVLEKESLFRRADGEPGTYAFVSNDDVAVALRIKTEDREFLLERVETAEMPLATAPIDDEPVVIEKPGNWPSFRGERASGVADGQHPPVVWDAEKGTNIRWKTEIPGLGHACPVIWQDQIFLVTAEGTSGNRELRAGQYGDVDSVQDESEHAWKVLCIEKRSGQIVWEQTAREGVPKVKRHLKSTHANATPATDGTHLIVNLGSEGFYCYDTEGALLWEKDLGELASGWFYDDAYEWGFGSSPIIYNEMVIVQCDVGKDSFIAAFRIDDGEEIWRTARDEIPAWSTPNIFDGPQRVELVTHAKNFSRAYDPATGEELWRLGPNSEVTVPTPIFGHGLIFLTSGYRNPKPIFAVRPGASGDISLAEGEDSSDHIQWSLEKDGPYLPTPIIYGEHLYVLRNNGILTCYEPTTGERVYRKRIGGDGGYTASPVAADGRLYFTSELGGTRVVRAGKEYEMLAINPLGDICMSTPAIADGMIFIRTQHHLLGIGRSGQTDSDDAAKSSDGTSTGRSGR